MIYGHAFRHRIHSLAIKEVATATTESMAECLRGEVDRFDAPRMS
jgi:hypothetical protein